MPRKINGRFLESELNEREVAVKIDINRLVGDYAPYKTKRISNIQALLLLLLIPCAVFHLFFFRKRKFIFLDIVKSGLSTKIFEKLENAWWIERFSSLERRLFLQPLRIYSHTCREEWEFTSGILKNLNQKLSFFYILLFYWCMKKKVFFTREDFYAESSCLASLSELWGGLAIVGFQHGSMDLGKIERLGVYPGKRANIQITHDVNTFNVFKRLSSDNKKILGPIPSYECIKFSASDCNKIIVIGNGDLLVQEQLLKIIKIILNDAKREGFTIYYKPHPSERVVVECSDFILLDNSKENFVLGGRESKVFIGVTSTVLYDACLMNQKVFILKNQKSETLDSLAKLKNIKEIEIEPNLWKSIHQQLLLADESVDVAWGFDEIFSQLQAGLVDKSSC